MIRAALLATLALGLLIGPAGASAAGKPNIVVVTTDDQPPSSFQRAVMPKLFADLLPSATRFTDFAVTTPLCCPSRATYLTGQYGHNNGVVRNQYGDLRQERNVLPVWLRHAGYKTAHVGKFLNGYERVAASRGAPAPGWDKWFTQLEPRRYYRWEAAKNGRVLKFGDEDADHATTVTTEVGVRWARKLARGGRPFYLAVDYYAPHIAGGRGAGCPSAPVPEPGYLKRYRSFPLPMPPNFNQADVSGASGPIRTLPLMRAPDIRRVARRYRCTVASLRGVDDGIAKLRETLRKTGALKDTVFVFMTDNGTFYGEHRIAKGKKHPFEEIVRVPFVIAVPDRLLGGGSQPTVADGPAANIDLAPTLLELAGAKPCWRPKRCRVLDGRSLLPLLGSRRGKFPEQRALGVEIKDCSYRGVRFAGYSYIEHMRESGRTCVVDESELYDLKRDPYQLRNLLPPKPGSKAQAVYEELVGKARSIEVCSGIEGRDPKPASGSYCE